MQADISAAVATAATSCAQAPAPDPDIDDKGFQRLSHRLAHTVARRLCFRAALVALDRPIVSFTFDDFPASAHELGAPLLEARGCRGTFYAATGLLGQKQPLWTVAGPDAVAALHAAGHEIGLHGHSHRPAQLMPGRMFAADLAANRAALRRLAPGLAGETFAYPFGITGLAQKRALAGLVRATRSVQPGLNAGRIDLDFIRAYELGERGIARAALDGLFEAAAARRAWLVFLTHDIAERPSRFGTTPSLLAAAIDGALARGMAVLPVREALDRIGLA